MSEITTVGLDHKKLKPIINKLRSMVFDSDVVSDIFDKYNLDEDEKSIIPICFAKIPVSARTDHGVIYINIDLLNGLDEVSEEELENIAHYVVHELTHYAQQTTGSKPTPVADADDYLDSPIEQEGFRNQSKYISQTQGDDEAEEYIDSVLDYHSNISKAPESKRKERRRKLLELVD